MQETHLGIKKYGMFDRIHDKNIGKGRQRDTSQSPEKY